MLQNDDPYWQERLRLAREEHERDQSLRLMVFAVDEPDGPVVGECNFAQIFRGPFQSCYLGYALDAGRQGKGLMAEALRAALGHVFGAMGLHRVQANYRPENLRSARLLARLGFQPEGIGKDYLVIDGAWRDHVLTALRNPAHPGPALTRRK